MKEIIKWIGGWMAGQMCLGTMPGPRFSLLLQTALPGWWPEPAARATGQGAGSWPNKVAHDREGGGGQG